LGRRKEKFPIKGKKGRGGGKEDEKGRTITHGYDFRKERKGALFPGAHRDKQKEKKRR